MSPVSVDNPPTRNLNPQLNSQSSGQSNAGGKDPFEGVTVPSSASGAARFSVTEEKQTAGSPDLKAQKAKLEAGLKAEQVIVANQKHQLSGAELLQKYDQYKPSALQIGTVATELLNKKDSDVFIPPETTEGTSGAYKQAVTKDYLLARKIILKSLSNALNQYEKGDPSAFVAWIKTWMPFIFSDGDGCMYNKTLNKTQNSCASGSLIDKAALRLTTWVTHMLGGKTAINSQRVSVLANMSVQGSEGPGTIHNGKSYPSYRTVSQISDCFDEVGIYSHRDPLFGALDIVGLGGAIKHKAGEPLKLSDKVIQFSEIVDEMNRTNNYLNKFNEIMKVKGLRVLEYKSLPEYLVSTRDESKLEHYLKFTDLTEQAFKLKWSDQKYAQELKALNIPMSSKHKELLAALEDPKNTDINIKTFSAALRYGKIVCFVPHAIDPYNIIDEQAKLDLIKLTVKGLRSPELKDFLFTKYNIPKDKDVFNINGISASHIDFSGQDPVNTITGEVYRDFNALADGLEEAKIKGIAAKGSPEQIIKIIANTPNPYCEITVNESKANFEAPSGFLVASGDSKSDKDLLAYGLLSGGAAFIARGQIDVNKHIGGALLDLLTTERFKDHEFALQEISPGKFKFLKTDEEIDRKPLIDKLIQHYTNPADPRISQQKTVTLNDAMWGGIWGEVIREIAAKYNKPELLAGLKEIVGLKDPSKPSLEVDPNAPWVKEFQEKRNVTDVSTPLIPRLWEMIQEENEEKGGNLKPFAERSPLHGIIAKIPLLGPVISLDRPTKSFKTSINLIIGGLLAGGLISGAATIAGNTQGEKLGMGIQKWTGRFQALFTGIALYMMTPHKFTLKPVGKLIEESASFIKDSVGSGLAGAMSYVGAGGVAVNGGMNNSLNIDSYVDRKGKESASYKAFKNPDEFYDIRIASSRLTDQRRKDLNYFRTEFMGGNLSKIPLLGEFVATVIPDLKMFLTMAKQFFTERGLREGVLKNMLPGSNHGIGAKMGKNNGMAYVAPHSEPHVFAGVVAATVFASVSGVLAKIFKADTAAKVLTGLSNVLPSIALVNHAKTAALNIDGEMTRFTDRYGEQMKFSPQVASKWQMIGGYMAGLGGLGLAMGEKNSITHKFHNLFQIVNKLGYAAFFKGFLEEMIPTIDNHVITNTQHQHETYIQNRPFNHLSKPEAELVTKLAMGENAANNIVSTQTNKAKLKQPALLQK
jgi:hypothetical protein